MEKHEKPYKQMKRINILLIMMIIVCLAVIVFLLSGTLNKVPDMQHNPTQPVVEATEPKEPETEPVTEALSDTTSLTWIETPYTKLGFPKQWESYLKYAQTSNKDLHTVSFMCTIAEQEIPLFDVFFGYTDLGEQMGYLTKGEERIPVCVLFYEYVPDETWREDDKVVLYAMQEAANDVITTIMTDENYIAQ